MRAKSELDLPAQGDSEHPSDTSGDAARVQRAIEDRRAFEPLHHRYGGSGHLLDGDPDDVRDR